MRYDDQVESMSGNRRASYQFGPYRFEPGQGLLRAGQFLPLPPKELAMLGTLLARKGETVTHEELWESVWPRQEASCASITRCIYELRRALGGDAQTYIVTVPRKGYRLAVPVNELTSRPKKSLIEKSISTTPRAYASFLEGLREANLAGPDHQQRAIDLFEEAHTLDPGYAVPLAAAADCRMYQTIRGWIRPSQGRQEMADVCERALAIDPGLASAVAALGWVEAVLGRNWGLGLKLVDEALTLDPEYARGLAHRGWILRSIGRLRESVDSMRMAVEIDPHSVLNVHALAWSLFLAGQHEEALDLERKMARETPWVDVAHGYVALIAGFLGYEDEAIIAGYRALDVSNQDPQAMTLMAYVLARTGHEDEARAMAATSQASKVPYTPRTRLAMVYAELGERERAIAFLRQAHADGCPWFPGARYDPRLGKLATDDEVVQLYDTAPS